MLREQEELEWEDDDNVVWSNKIAPDSVLVLARLTGDYYMPGERFLGPTPRINPETGQIELIQNKA